MHLFLTPQGFFKPGAYVGRDTSRRGVGPGTDWRWQRCAASAVPRLLRSGPCVCSGWPGQLGHRGLTCRTPRCSSRLASVPTPATSPWSTQLPHVGARLPRDPVSRRGRADSLVAHVVCVRTRAQQRPVKSAKVSSWKETSARCCATCSGHRLHRALWPEGVLSPAAQGRLLAPSSCVSVSRPAHGGHRRPPGTRAVGLRAHSHTPRHTCILHTPAHTPTHTHMDSHKLSHVLYPQPRTTTLVCFRAAAGEFPSREALVLRASRTPSLQAPLHSGAPRNPHQHQRGWAGRRQSRVGSTPGRPLLKGDIGSLLKSTEGRPAGSHQGRSWHLLDGRSLTGLTSKPSLPAGRPLTCT